MLQSIGKKKIIFYIFLFIFLSTQISIKQKNKDNFISNSNFFEVIGLSDENNSKVHKSLNFLINKNIFLINKSDFKNIFQENNLVQSFSIKKIYPNKIKIQIKQTELLAITNRNNEKFFIGLNGKLIAVNEIKNFTNELPFVYSNKNYIDFINLKKIIDKSKFNFDEIESFYYFPSGRWDIKTKDGFLIKLPKEKLIESLKTARLIKSNKKFEDKKIIDLRIPSNIILSNE